MSQNDYLSDKIYFIDLMALWANNHTERYGQQQILFVLTTSKPVFNLLKIIFVYHSYH